jgi:hypothetical protein
MVVFLSLIERAVSRPPLAAIVFRSRVDVDRFPDANNA